MPSHSHYFTELEARCGELCAKYIQPMIDAEVRALHDGKPVPAPDFDHMASYRLLVHAELEGYFERRSKAAIDTLQTEMKAGMVLTQRMASIVALYLWRTQWRPLWPGPSSDRNVFKQVAQDALGFATSFISGNNGIKEDSIEMLSALMGYFPDEIDRVLVTELNELGKRRGDVAHESWTKNTRTFESAQIEKDRIERILRLVKTSYESTTPTTSATAHPSFWAKLFDRRRS